MTTDSEHPQLAMPSTQARRSGGNRIRLFIDQANLDLTMQSEARNRRIDWRGFDWTRLSDWLVEQAATVCRVNDPMHEGTRIYASFDPNDPTHRKRHEWLQWLDRQAGVQVSISNMRPRNPPNCQNCHKRVDHCPYCKEQLRLRVEKGVDTAIVTDMVSLAWQDAYDIAVLASWDSDFIPVVQTLDQRGLKVVQAGFPPGGDQLRRACWGQIDVFGGHAQLGR